MSQNIFDYYSTHLPTCKSRICFLDTWKKSCQMMVLTKFMQWENKPNHITINKCRTCIKFMVTGRTQYNFGSEDGDHEMPVSVCGGNVDQLTFSKDHAGHSSIRPMIAKKSTATANFQLIFLIFSGKFWVLFPLPAHSCILPCIFGR